MRRIADLRIGLVATLHGQRDGDALRRRIGERVRQGRVDRVVVDLDFAEELVVLLLAGRHVERAERDVGVVGLGLHAFAIQVVIVGDLEVELHRTAVDGLGFHLEGLFDRQQIVRGVGRERVTGEKGE